MTTNERIVRRIRKWGKPKHKVPEWWGWSVALAQFHLAECDWNKIGVGIEHCSCGLTRCIAKVRSDRDEELLAVIAPVLAPGNENVSRGDALAAIRDLVQIAIGKTIPDDKA